MMLIQNIKLALQSLRSNKTRTFLTTLGIVIGIGSVLLIAALGEGFKNQIKDQVKQFGDDLITIQPGNIVSRKGNGTLDDVHLKSALSLFGTSNLTEEDLIRVGELPEIESITPISLITGVATANNKSYSNGLIIGAYDSFPKIFNQKIAFGEFFTKEEYSKPVVAIGSKVAEDLFNEEAPIGRTITVKGQDFIVRAVIKPFESALLGASIDINTSIFMPFPVAKGLNGSSVQIAKILVKPKSGIEISTVIAKINSVFKNTHGGQQDYTILTQTEAVSVAGSVIGLATGLIAAVAGVSLVVGGIGIMNIMLLSVSERTKEIGIRKSIGATSKQILMQFLLESISLSVVGGTIALIINSVIIMIIRYQTVYKPVFTFSMILTSMAVCLLIGIIFGLVPALKASRKDPIQSLRGL